MGIYILLCANLLMLWLSLRKGGSVSFRMLCLVVSGVLLVLTVVEFFHNISDAMAFFHVLRQLPP